jgi:hypothetical protein
MALLRRRRVAGSKRASTKAAPKKSVSIAALTPKAAPVEKKAPAIPKLKVDFKVQDYDDHYRLKLERGGNEVEFYFQTEGTPFCCGLHEMGNFGIEGHNDQDDDDIKPSDRITRTEIVTEIRNAIERVIREKFTRGRMSESVVLTLISDDACDYVREALEDGKLFQEVKTFTNSNSHNENTLYVSTN